MGLARPATILILWLWLWSGVAARAQAPTVAAIQEMVAQVAEITGFKPKRVVPSETITKENWKRWLEEELKRKVKPEEILAQEIALKKFGLVPRDYDLRKSVVELYTEQAAAFYDARKKRMTFVEGFLDQTVALTLPHELAHALADQHYNLERFLDKAAANDDAQLARLAVAEGQATWVMLETTVRKLGQSFFENPKLIDQYASAISDAGSAATPVLQGAPLYIRRTLVFPYSHGLRFQNRIVEKLGKPAFDRVLRQPPETTQEVIHPDLYLAGVRPTQPALPETRHLRDFKRLTEGTFGEIDVQLLIEQFETPEAGERLAPGWRGGTYAVWQHKAGRVNVLCWAIDWETADQAREFVARYRRVLKGKLKKADLTVDAAGELGGSSEEGGFTIRALDRRTEGVEGFATPEAPTRL